MTMMTLKYHRILPDVSVSLLKDKDTGKKLFRYRWRQTGGKAGSAGTQTHKDYPHKSKRYKGFIEFEQFIKDKFNYE